MKNKALGEFGDRTHSMTYGISQIHMKELNKIVKEFPDLQFVLSSSWRKLFTIEEMNNILICEGFKGFLIDRTPSSNHNRGFEIRTWLENNVGEDFENLCKFVILDDDKDMGSLLPHLIKTSWEDGLTEVEVNQVIQYLKG